MHIDLVFTQDLYLIVRLRCPLHVLKHTPCVFVDMHVHSTCCIPACYVFTPAELYSAVLCVRQASTDRHTQRSPSSASTHTCLHAVGVRYQHSAGCNCTAAGATVDSHCPSFVQPRRRQSCNECTAEADNSNIPDWEWGLDASGRMHYTVKTLGHALTRLTANMAINVLADQRLVCYRREACVDSLCESVAVRMSRLDYLTIPSRADESWPPEPSTSYSCFDFEPNYGTLDLRGELSCRPALSSSAYVPPPPYECSITFWESPLLITSDTVVRQATRDERSAFAYHRSGFDVGAAHDFSAFDLYLSLDGHADKSYESVRPLYVFLEPKQHHHTGRLRLPLVPTAARA